jgi:Domain of unknown function (DUF4389)
VAFGITTMIAGVAILITGRYPRSLFEFNVGVLRWNWRVGFYVDAALATDRYPPFTLARADYPADLEVVYPERLSRGLVLIKSWLLALPHLIIVSLLAPHSPVVVDRHRPDGRPPAHRRLLDAQPDRRPRRILPVDHQAVPRSVFDLLMGINRWLYRVLDYVALMRDEYPPFRLDQGQEEPDEVQTVPSAAYVPRRVSYSSAGKDPVCRSARAEHTGQIHRMAGTISDQIASRMSTPCPS